MVAREQTPLLQPRRNSNDSNDSDVDADEDGQRNRPVACREVPPQICSKIVSRIKAMVLRLLPLEVESEDITSATGSILNRDVVKAFHTAGGDYSDAIPYCLLVARMSFHKDAYRNPSDFDEHMNHKLACEVIARRVVAGHFDAQRQHVVLSTRYTHIESDGDVSLPLSAIELASDQHCPIFLSSAESQKTVFALWKGHLVQGRDSRGHVVYELWKRKKGLDPSRLAVPRYQNILRVVLWIVFLVNYTLAIQTPDREFGVEDYIFYIQVLGYTLEEIVRFTKIRSIAALTFWTCVSLLIYSIAFVALGYRIADLATHKEKAALHYRLLSFQILSCAAPLVWAKLLTVFDLFSFFGSMQIVVGRMMKESVVFFTLLAILSMGFLQALTGLDVADNSHDATSQIIHSLLQGLLGSPDFDSYMTKDKSYPFGMVLYYAWTVLTIIILLNILIALFNSAYETVSEDAIAQYMAFFSQKTIAGVRAPDQFVYVAPFNLLELFLLPLELCVSVEVYTKINNVIMSVLFFPILCIIAIFEAHWEKGTYQRGREPTLDEDGIDYSLDEDPDMASISGLSRSEARSGGEIAKVKFEELVKVFPDLQSSTTSQILAEVKKLRKELDDVKREVREGSAQPVKKEED